MRTGFKKFSVVAGFVLLLIVLIVNAAVTKRQLNRQVATGLWVAHTRRVELQLSETLALLTEAETGQRGFLYTGDELYLAPYDHASQQIQSQIDELAQLTSDNPRQQAAIGELRSLARTKLDELAATIKLYRSGKLDEARKLVLTNAGIQTMDNFRAVLGNMQSEEDRLERQRESSYRVSITQTSASIYLTTALAALGLILLAYSFCGK